MFAIKNKYIYITLGVISFPSICLNSSYVFAQENENGKVELDVEVTKEKLSRKFILPSSEDIQNMTKEELLEEIKNNDSDIIDMMENMRIAKEQVQILEQQLNSFEIQKEKYSLKRDDLNIDPSDLLSANKIKALNILPSLNMIEDSIKEIEDYTESIAKDKENLEKINSNINLIDRNLLYKDDYLKSIQKLKDYLDNENSKVEASKAKVNDRVRILNSMTTSSNNPYASQGVNVSIPSNIDSPELIRNIISIMSEYIGVPYVWGGTSPNGFDCSGLMKYSFAKVGINLPRTAREQQRVCSKIEYNELKPGDLIFWNNPATHVALYIGEGKIIEAPRTGLNVRSRYIKPTEKGISYGRLFN